MSRPKLPSTPEEQHQLELGRERKLAKLERERQLRVVAEAKSQEAHWRKYPSVKTRRRYQEVRVKLGYTKSSNALTWACLAKRTTFIWKFETLAENIQWVWETSMLQIAESGYAINGRSFIVLNNVQEAFGVAISDLLDDQRNAAIFIPRAIAVVCLLKSGLTHSETARQLCRDHTTIRNARQRVAFLFEGIADVQNISSERSSPVRSEGGQLPAPIHDGSTGPDPTAQV